MALPKTDFPAVRACIFDMDGLLINSEDIVAQFTKNLLKKLMGVADSTKGELFHNWAKLPISREQFALESSEAMRLLFPNCMPLPGAKKILTDLSCARSAASGDVIQLALASSTKTHSYKLKTSRLESKRLLSFFPPDRKILLDDPRVRQGRGKPAPDIYLVALQVLNSGLEPGESPILPSECLVFEDSIAGVEAGRRAGMRVVWVPHPDVAAEYQPRYKDILAGRSGRFQVGDNWQLGEVDDGWAESIPSLEEFDYEKYGLNVRS
ncbi:hypothetical protein PENVUL_c011G09900 [Penicillium vulpinum]|uniref:GS1-like protein n=1 Tax=Penicillium vulpinum TaxID=29845 RepID=A0A1V6S243_9EURO|nr:hypothetical protein PENVUL_c011G09900 [Penicillium vulpinum]